MMHMLINPAKVQLVTSQKKQALANTTAAQPSPLLVPHNQLYNAPARKAAVKGLILEDSLTVVYGLPKTGKSFLMIDLAMSVAHGLPFMGHQTQQGQVIYLGYEGASSLPDRVLAWETNRTNNSAQVHVMGRKHINLLNPGDVDQLIGEIGSLHSAENPVRIVVVDTLNRAIPGADENASGTMSAVVNVCDQIRQVTKAAVILVHHSAKSGNSHSPRGHSALLGAVDVSICIEKKGHYSTATVEAARDLPTGASFLFKLKPVSITRSDGSKGVSCVAELVPPSKISTTPKGKSAKAAKNQAQYDAIRLAGILEHQMAAGSGAEAGQADGKAFTGTPDDLKASRKVLLEQLEQEERAESSSDQFDEKRLRIRCQKRVTRAEEVLRASRRLQNEGDDITLSASTAPDPDADRS